MKPNLPPEFAWIKEGVKADYHSRISGPVTHSGVIQHEPFKSLCGSRWVTFVSGKAGVVSCEHLRPVPGGE